MSISLRKSIQSDLEEFFLNQTDEEADFMAAFTPINPLDKEAYMKKWNRLLKDNTIHMQTIINKSNMVLGSVVKFVMDGENDITYAINKEYWGKGIATEAVRLFLNIEKNRPLFGRVANDNYGSQRVLEKSGFLKIGSNVAFANARKKEIQEYIYRLDK